MKPKEKVNEDDETEWEDCSDAEQSGEDDDADAELSNSEVNFIQFSRRQLADCT
jgi:hypothetical protein